MKTPKIITTESSQSNMAHTPTNRLLSAAPPILSDADREFLEAREQIVSSFFNSVYKTSIIAAKALAEIRDHDGGRLWRATHASFTAYCRARWGYEKGRTSQLAKSGEIFLEIEKAATGEYNFGDRLPTRESHVRPLSDVDVGKRAACWAAVVREHAPADVTEDIVAAVAAKYVPPKTEPSASLKLPPSSKTRAFDLLEKMRAATETLPAAAEIKLLLGKIEALI